MSLNLRSIFMSIATFIGAHKLHSSGCSSASMLLVLRRWLIQLFDEIIEVEISVGAEKRKVANEVKNHPFFQPVNIVAIMPRRVEDSSKSCQSCFLVKAKKKTHHDLFMLLTIQDKSLSCWKFVSALAKLIYSRCQESLWIHKIVKLRISSLPIAGKWEQEHRCKMVTNRKSRDAFFICCRRHRTTNECW